MERDRHVAVVTDTGTSMLPNSPEAQNLKVTVVPLEIKFWEKGEYIPYSDDSKEIVNANDFYQKMRSSKKLPETTGALPGRFVETFRNLKEKAGSIISINITAKESGVWQSAVTAKNNVQEEAGPKTAIEVVDSKLVSLAAWFPVRAAANASILGATLRQIEDEVAEVIKKTQLYVTLETFDNLRKGGRAKDVVSAMIASLLSIYPVMGFADGKLKILGKGRSVQKARDQMIEMVGDAGNLVRLAVVHTNAPALAHKIKEALKGMIKEDIPIYDVKGALAVHAGEGAVGIAFQKA